MSTFEQIEEQRDLVAGLEYEERWEMRMSEPGHVDAAQISVYKDDAGEWRWHARDTNGEIVAESGEGYVEHTAAIKAASDLFPDAGIRDYDDSL